MLVRVRRGVTVGYMCDTYREYGDVRASLDVCSAVVALLWTVCSSSSSSNVVSDAQVWPPNFYAVQMNLAEVVGK